MEEINEMKGFDGVVGHQEIISHLQNAIRLGKVSHAYIFGGEHGAGKKLLASLFAMTLQCQEQGVEPCMKCPSCRKALNKNHPDIIYVVHEKPNSIGIDEIRGQLINDVGIRPYESPYKIYIVNDADKLTLQAQNALLKTIEEPPAYAVILLLADNPDALLPTITSRCVLLSLKPVGDRLVKDYLMERMHIPDYQAEVQAAFAQGNIGKAKKTAESTYASNEEQFHCEPQTHIFFYENEMRGRNLQSGVEIQVPYSQVVMVMETKHLFLIRIPEKRMVLVDKGGFQRGNSSEFGAFLREKCTAAKFG